MQRPHKTIAAAVAAARDGAVICVAEGTYEGNVIADNRCGRGGARFLNDDKPHLPRLRCSRAARASKGA